MTIQEVIKATDWQKKWSVPNYTLISSSLLNEGYDKYTKKRFGIGLPHEFYVYKDRAIICYQSGKENERFGTQVAKRIITNKKFLLELIQELNEKTLEFRRFMKKDLRVNNFLQFKKLHFEYLPAFIAVSRSANYVTGKNAHQILAKLKKIRLFTESVYTEADDYLKKFLKSNLQTRLYYSELEKYFANKKLLNKNDLQKRIGLYYYNSKFQFFTQTDINKFEKSIAESFKLKSGIAKGQTAYRGFARGRVRIIFNPSKSKKFDQGDILITSMTRPQFVPLMKKAGAIVTDAGGILSHAAIVSREFKKPCIIGTQTATKAFKEGEVVEVDANKGVVRKV